MKTFEDVFAGWAVQPCIQAFNNYNEFVNLPFEEYSILIGEMLRELVVVLKRLEEFNLFHVTKYSLGNDEVALLDSTQLIDGVMKQILNDKDKRFSSLWLDGDTGIYDNGKLETSKNIIRVGYEFFINVISIDTFSDVWMPIDYDLAEINFDRARINSLRLEACLLSIKSSSFKVVPDEEEVFQGYIARQVGFRIYYPESFVANVASGDLNSLDGFIYEAPSS